MEPGERLPRGTPAESNPAVYKSGRSVRLGVGLRPDPGAAEDQLPGQHAAPGAEDGLHEEAALGGGADAGDVDQGGDVCHQGEHCGEVEPPQDFGSAPGHAEIHDHHQGVERIWIHSV